MDTDSEKAVAYIARATQLLELAAQLPDENSRQVLIETAKQYERFAAALISKQCSGNSNQHLVR
jgi:hypothetical protein